MQTFEYPNLVPGTDEWLDWWTPKTGAANVTNNHMYKIELPEPLKADDTIGVSLDVEFKGLDLMADGAKFGIQGACVVDGADSFEYYNPFSGLLYMTKYGHFSDGLFTGFHTISNVGKVSDRTYSSSGYPMSPVGLSKFYVGMKVDYWGGGRPRAAAHGHAQRGRCPARLGTGRRGGVAVDDR